MQSKPSRNNIKLSPRLKTIADMVESCDRVIDVGTDHAFLPIYLLSNGICPTALGTDINKGPVNRAIKNIQKHGLESKIKVLHTNGLNAVEINKNDSIIISGMGGFEIMSILGKIKTPPKVIFLQPQKSLYELREFLAERGFEIAIEKIIKESHRYYIVIKAFFTQKKYNLSEYEKYVGPKIIANKPAHYNDYLAHLKEKIQKEIKGKPEYLSILNEIESELDNENK